MTRLFDVPGLATHARGLKTTAEALYLRDHFIEQLELAGIEDDPAVAAARRTVVVVGASYSGTELVAQLRALADAAARQMGFDPADVSFLLLDTAEQVMPEVGEKLGTPRWQYCAAAASMSVSAPRSRRPTLITLCSAMIRASTRTRSPG